MDAPPTGRSKVTKYPYRNPVVRFALSLTHNLRLGGGQIVHRTHLENALVPFVLLRSRISRVRIPDQRDR
jgi:hypothetical protein